MWVWTLQGALLNTAQVVSLEVLPPGGLEPGSDEEHEHDGEHGHEEGEGAFLLTAFLADGGEAPLLQTPDPEGAEAMLAALAQVLAGDPRWDGARRDGWVDLGAVAARLAGWGEE